MTKNKIVLIAGDPNSINSEIIFKTWKKINNNIKKKIYLIVNFELFRLQLKKFNFKIKLIKVKNFHNDQKINGLKIIDVPLNFSNPFKVTHKNASKYIRKSLNLGHKLSNDKKFKGLINCPINKGLIHKSKKTGVTEYLASKCKIKDRSELMLIYNKKLSVAPVTTHIDIKKVSKKITSKLIIKKMLTLNTQFKKLFKKKPKICLLGLNPHNSELLDGSEEVKKIKPSVLFLKKKGLVIEGPFAADSIFIDNYKNYDVVVGMYHDQVLAPFKSMFKYDAINLTLGLDYIRVSPDHGTATNIIGKNKSNYTSLLQCIKFINNLK